MNSGTYLDERFRQQRNAFTVPAGDEELIADEWRQMHIWAGRLVPDREADRNDQHPFSAVANRLPLALGRLLERFDGSKRILITRARFYFPVETGSQIRTPDRLCIECAAIAQRFV